MMQVRLRNKIHRLVLSSRDRRGAQDQNDECSKEYRCRDAENAQVFSGFLIEAYAHVAKAGGGDAYKRGDLALAHGNTADTTFDRHMATTGANFSCQQCHKVSNHRIAGRGSDLAPTDYDFPMSCSSTECHPTKGSPAGHTTQAVNRHVDRVSCQTCHIKTYGKNASDSTATEATEYHRDWSLPHYNATTGLWHPTSYLENNRIPVYKFWNKNSTNYLLYDVTNPNPLTGNYTTSKPVGSITDLTTASKLYPFKYKTAYQPLATRLNVLIALDTSVYWTGVFTNPADRVVAAIAAGIANMGFNSDEPYAFVNTETNQLITHGVPPASQTLTCNECHGSANQMNLRSIGYQLKNSTQMVCTQCHGSEDDQLNFEQLHRKHVQEEGRGCSWCHNFSRPERGLNENFHSYALTINKPGTGNGTVTSADGGINCGTDCTESYGANTRVTLTATPAVDGIFTGWAGGCTGKNTTCSITMNSYKEVSATFIPAQPVLYFAKDYINFGKVKVGKMKTKKFSIKNKGNADLVISGVNVNNPLFTTDWAGQVVIKPKKSYKLKVIFTPTNVGTQVGVLTISSNDDHSPTLVSLSAEGK